MLPPPELSLGEAPFAAVRLLVTLPFARCGRPEPEVSAFAVAGLPPVRACAGLPPERAGAASSAGAGGVYG